MCPFNLCRLLASFTRIPDSLANLQKSSITFNTHITVFRHTQLSTLFSPANVFILGPHLEMFKCYSWWCFGNHTEFREPNRNWSYGILLSFQSHHHFDFSSKPQSNSVNMCCLSQATLLRYIFGGRVGRRGAWLHQQQSELTPDDACGTIFRTWD